MTRSYIKYIYSTHPILTLSTFAEPKMPVFQPYAM